MTNMFSSDVDALTAVKTKYGNDPEKAWEALAHSQSHIAKLETENSEYKTKVTTSKTLEEVMAALKSNTPPPPVPADPPKPSVLDENTLKQKVEEIFAQNSEAQRRQETAARIERTLLEKFGDGTKANAAVKAKALELGLTPEALGEFALKSDKAFFKLFDISESAPANIAPTKGNVNPQALHSNPKGDNAAPGTPAYYAELRRTKPNEYFSPKVQNEIMAAAMKDPVKFGINV